MFIPINYFNDNPISVDIINYISISMAILFFVIYIFQHIHLIVSMFSKSKQWPDAKENHNYGFLIAGRNEAKVIGNLIDSIYKQDYPKDKIKVFVCADNCTDDTAKIAREHGAIVFERSNKILIGKSYAMDFLIKSILNDQNYKDIECFLVMDADNLVSKTYLKEMNKSFDSGILVSTSFRESKNFGTNWISGCSSLTFYRECLLVHHSREKMGMGTYVSGTGYFVARKVLEQLGGWNFNTMTEDIEFSIWCATNNILISYNENAVFYDEQPETLSVANTQRLRWCKGTHQCCETYESSLFKGLFKSEHKLTCYELLTHVTPFPIISILWLLIYIILHFALFLAGHETGLYFLFKTFTNVSIFFITIIIISQIHALVSVIKNKERLMNYSFKFKVKCILLFPLFVGLMIPLSIKALFKKKVVWKQIPHTKQVNIESFENS